MKLRLLLLHPAAEITSIQKDWERMWEKRQDLQDRGRVKSKVGSRGLFADSFVSLFLTLTVITFIIKNVVDSYFNPEFSLTKYYITGISQIPAQIALLVYHPTHEKNSDEVRAKKMAAEFA